jgi:hypothetical protein
MAAGLNRGDGGGAAGMGEETRCDDGVLKRSNLYVSRRLGDDDLRVVRVVFDEATPMISTIFD